MTWKKVIRTRGIGDLWRAETLDGIVGEIVRVRTYHKPRMPEVCFRLSVWCVSTKDTRPRFPHVEVYFCTLREAKEGFFIYCRAYTAGKVDAKVAGV